MSPFTGFGAYNMIVFAWNCWGYFCSFQRLVARCSSVDVGMHCHAGGSQTPTTPTRGRRPPRALAALCTLAACLWYLSSTARIATAAPAAGGRTATQAGAQYPTLSGQPVLPPGHPTPIKEELFILGVSLPLLGHIMPIYQLLEQLQAGGHRVALLTVDVGTRASPCAVVWPCGICQRN
jgi:hypothetical protein